MHQPVMLGEAVDSLNLKHGSIVMDATVGCGGHAKEILKKITPGGFLIGLDADASALERAAEELDSFKGSFKLFNENFRNLDKVLSKENFKSIDAALFDVGISSYQLEDAERGFSIKHDATLDMRMDRRLDRSAYDIVNRYSEEDISGIIEKFGEERSHRKIARHIMEARGAGPIRTTHELAAIVRKAVSFRRPRGRQIDPATKTFQAFRIVVNDELASLEEGIKNAVYWLEQAGRICVISFHSLEDRIVKRLFKGYSDLGILKVLTKKPLRPAWIEVSANPRARSSRLRAAERI